MPFSIEPSNVKVRSLDLDFHELSWEMVDQTVDIWDYTFQIFRSESGEGPYEAISVPFEDRYAFIDNFLQIGHKWRVLFYRIRITNKVSGEWKDFGPYSTLPEPDLVTMEVRRHINLLMQEFAGRRLWVLPVRTFGQRCFLPGTAIQGAVVGASRAWYKGKTVQLTTKKGFCLTVTANHPVLTSQGFAPAQTIRVGDDLVCYGIEPDGTVAPVVPNRNEQQQPALSEDVFSALAKRSGAQSTRAVGLDFHGEAQNFVGDVEVVGSYLELLLHDQAAIQEQVRQIILESSSPREFAGVGLRPEDTFLERLHASSGSLVGSGDLPIFGSLIPEAPQLVLRLGPPSQAGSPLLDCVAETFSRNTQLPGELIQRGPGVVAFDQVVDVRVADYAGHVFDFQTLTGWIVASGIVSSNCDCWSPTLSRRTRSGCIRCYDTGFVRGYMAPIEIWGQIDPAPKTDQVLNVGATQQVNSTGKTGYYPPLKPRDVLVESENKRWRIVKVGQTEKGRATLHQELEVHEIPPKDIEFSIPLDLDKPLRELAITPARNYSNPQNLDSYERDVVGNLLELYAKRPR